MLYINPKFDGVPGSCILPIYENSLYFRYVMAILIISSNPLFSDIAESKGPHNDVAVIARGLLRVDFSSDLFYFGSSIIGLTG